MIPGKNYTPELILSIAWRRKWLIVIPAILVAVMGVVITRLLPDKYRSEATILVVPQRVPENYVRPAITTRIEERLRSINQQVRSRARLERIIEDENLYVDRRKTDIMQDIVDDMSKAIDVDIVQGDVFRVAFTSDNPRTAKSVADKLTSFFIDESLKDRTVLAENTSTFLETEVAAADRKLKAVEEQIAAFKREHDGELPTQAEANRLGLQGARGDLQNTINTLEKLQEEKARLQRLLAQLQEAADAAAAAPPPVVVDAGGPRTKAQELAAARAEVAKLQKEGKKSGHPDLDKALRKIPGLEREAAEEAAASTPLGAAPAAAGNPTLAQRLRDIADARRDLDNTNKNIERNLEYQRGLIKDINEYQRRLAIAPIRDNELTQLTRDLPTLKGHYESLSSKRIDSQVSANVERQQIGEQFRILDPARLPEKPSSPNRDQLYVMSAVLAILVGLGVAGCFEYLDRGLRSEDDVRLALALPVLATIPVIGEQPKGSLRRRLMGSAALLLVTLVAASSWLVLR